MKNLNAPKKRHGFRNIIFIIIVVFVGIAAIGNSSSKSDNTIAEGTKAESVKMPAVEPSKPDLELLSHEYKPGEYYPSIVGKVRNNTSKTYSYASVEINLYDKEKAQIGSTLANINNLEPGAIWKFEAVILEENVASYRIKEISGF